MLTRHHAHVTLTYVLRACNFFPPHHTCMHVNSAPKDASTSIARVLVQIYTHPLTQPQYASKKKSAQARVSLVACQNLRQQIYLCGATDFQAALFTSPEPNCVLHPTAPQNIRRGGGCNIILICKISAPGETNHRRARCAFYFRFTCCWRVTHMRILARRRGGGWVSGYVLRCGGRWREKNGTRLAHVSAIGILFVRV